ncbi:MAG: EAL domain-containing protein [Nitrosomonadales bacterium]|nr:EAL domain-containing protein [Nitrosomonadales bacterium]
MKLGKKLLLTALIPMLIVLLSGGLVMWQTNRMLENFAVVDDTYYSSALAALEMQVDFKEQVQQWKDMLLRINSPDERNKHWAEFQRVENEIDTDGGKLALMLGDSKAAPLIVDFVASHKKAGEAYRKSLGLLLGGHFDVTHANTIIGEIDKQLSEKLKISVNLISEESDAFSRKTQDDALRATILSFLGMFLTLLIAAILFLRSLNKHVLFPIGLLSDFARKFGTGDRSQCIYFKSDDEIGTLTETFNQAWERIETLVTNLETSKTRYRNLLQGIDAIIWELDPKTNKYTFISQRVEELMGYPLSSWLSEPGFLDQHCHPDDLAICREKIRNTLEEGATSEYIHRAIAANGNVVWLNNRIKLIRDEQSKESFVLGVMVDISKMKQYEDRMAYLSSHSELTGLANRNLLVDRLERAIAHATGKGNMAALLLVNIDRFKLINESLGHKLGDELIKSIAQRLQAIIGTDDTLAHLGGDEFAVVLRDVHKPEDAAEAAREILRLVAMPMEISGNALVTNCSIGIGIYPKDGRDASTLLKNAGSALTSVKQQERNNYKFYTEQMNAKALFSLKLENKMRNAIENMEFALYYQPQINITENRIVGVEALIRWIQPGEPMVPPSHFIPLAEETNLILPIGEWVLREACRQNKAWQDKGIAPFCVAVNLSASQFAQPDITGLVARILDETGLDPQYLELEITESVMMQEVELVIKNLKALHRLGVKLAIDDFGTGYSSLSYLKRLPIDKLKVDQSFVQDIAVNSDDEAIVATIISMAHNLKIGVIAEGVETEAQLQYLRDRQCDEVQGYFFSKPLAADLLEEYLSSGGPFSTGMQSKQVPIQSMPR